jgi:hypothetical protein
MTKFFVRLLILLWVPAAAMLGATYDVRNYGAKADAKSNDAPAIQSAIDACAAAGGGTVLVPAGNYLTGMLRFRSHVTLRLENGATLQASRRRADYTPSGHGERMTFGSAETTLRNDYRYLLVADDQESIALEGDGTIRGTGEADLRRRNGSDQQPMPEFRLGILMFRNCRNVAMRDLTIRDSDFWTLHFWRCDRLFLRGLSILNNYYHTNSDGIDPVSCRDVFISDCVIVAGDDCICLKADPDRACEQVVVTNCTVESVATAIKLGTASHADFRDVLISNCTIRNSNVGVGIYIKDGGTAERVTFSNLSIVTQDKPEEAADYLRNRSFPLFIDVEQRNDRSRVGGVREMTFRDIHIRSDNAVLFQGMPESPLRNITLQNILFSVDRGFDFAKRQKAVGGTGNPRDRRISLYARKPSYVTLAHIDGLLVDNVQVQVDDKIFAEYPRSAVAVFETTHARLQNIGRRPAGSETGEPVLTLDNCRSAFITGCQAAAGTPVFAGIRGERTDEIAFVYNDLQGAKIPVELATVVRPAAVRGISR